MPLGGNYTVAEWTEIEASASFETVSDDQLALLHRHWIWADHARLTFDEALQTEHWDHEDIAAKTPGAMYMWYGLLQVVIEGATQRRVRYGGEFLRDTRSVRRALEDSRNATFHVGSPDSYLDERLLGIVSQSPFQIYRAHQGLGQLMLDEMRRRRADRQTAG